MIISFPSAATARFIQTCLDLALRSRGIDTLIISGGSTDVGVCATVFAGRDRDYNLIVAQRRLRHQPRSA